MTDPVTPMGGATPEQVAEELRARQAAAPTGVTEVDPQILLAAIQQMQEQIAALQAEKTAGGKAPLLVVSESVASLVGHIAADTAGHQLALDLADAAGNAVKSGDGAAVEKLAGKLERWLTRNAPAPGENYHYKTVLDLVRNHLPDHLDELTPPPVPVASLSGGAPAKVITGSVTG